MKNKYRDTSQESKSAVSSQTKWKWFVTDQVKCVYFNNLNAHWQIDY